MEKMEEWFQVLNKKIDTIGGDVIAIRGELSDIRDLKNSAASGRDSSMLREGNHHISPASLGPPSADRDCGGPAFIEQHQSDIRLCKLAIERIDDKVEALKKNPEFK